MAREYRMMQEGMRGMIYNTKAHINAVLHLNTPGYKRYKFVNYMNANEDIIPIQFIDWHKEHPVASNRALDFYISGKLNLFCLEPQGDLELYTADGRFIRDKDGLLHSIAHRLPVMGTKGLIYLSTDTPIIQDNGDIYENGTYVNTLKIASFDGPDGLWTIEGSVFYKREPKKVKEVKRTDYTIIQGFFEAENEPPGRMTMKTILPFVEGAANSFKLYSKSHNYMFKAVID